MFLGAFLAASRNSGERHPKSNLSEVLCFNVKQLGKLELYGRASSGTGALRGRSLAAFFAVGWAGAFVQSTAAGARARNWGRNQGPNRAHRRYGLKWRRNGSTGDAGGLPGGLGCTAIRRRASRLGISNFGTIELYVPPPVDEPQGGADGAGGLFSVADGHTILRRDGNWSVKPAAPMRTG